MMITRDDLLRGAERVRHGGKAPGIDGISVDEALRHADLLVDELCAALHAGTYQAQPLRRVMIPKRNGGERCLGIPTIADRVVGQAALIKLMTLLPNQQHPAAHAYVAGRGAHSALQQAECWRQAGDCQALAADIQNFFPSIDRQALFADLARLLPDHHDFLDLVRQLVSVPYDGESQAPDRGIPQGVACSPLLSNCFLQPVDVALSETGHYLRYCDNLLLLDRDAQCLEERAQQVGEHLRQRGLSLKASGTVLAPLSDGVPFLGFTLTSDGPCPGPGSDEHLRETLVAAEQHAQWAQRHLSVGEVKQHLSRWASYFKRPPSPPVPAPSADDQALAAQAHELLAEIRLVVEGDGIQHLQRYGSRLAAFAGLRDRRFHCEVAVWHLAAGDYAAAEAALERHRHLEPCDPCAAYLRARLHIQRRCPDQALSELEDCLRYEPCFGEAYRLQAAIYRQLGVETLAAGAEHELAQLPRDCSAGMAELLQLAHRQPSVKGTAEERDAALRALRGHKGLHARAFADVAGRLSYRPQQDGIDHHAFSEHLHGRLSLAAYPVRTDGSARWGVLDVDVRQKSLQRHRYDDERLREMRAQAWSHCQKLCAVARNHGLDLIAEDTGGRGFHLWLLLADALPADSLRQALLAIARLAGDAPSCIAVEVFPAHTSCGTDQPGVRVKLPWGIHRASGRRSYLLDRHGEPDVHQFQALLRARRASRGDLQRLTEQQASAAPCSQAAQNPVAAVLSGCGVLASLARKAEQLRHLTHHERTIIASVLKPLGEAGRAAIHRIIGGTINYDRHTTEAHITKQHDQPMGCKRIGILCPGLAGSEVCRCRFPQRNNTYPSPTRHAHVHPNLHAITRSKDSKRAAPTPGSTSTPAAPNQRSKPPAPLAHSTPAAAPATTAPNPAPTAAALPATMTPPTQVMPPAPLAAHTASASTSANPPAASAPQATPRPAPTPPPAVGADPLGQALAAQQQALLSKAHLRQALEAAGGELVSAAGHARLDDHGTIWVAL